MLNFKNTSLVFVLLAVLLWRTNQPVGWLLILVLLYLFILFLGSYRIGSQFYMPVICGGLPTEKKIAISFDDGPADSFTPEILDILQQKQVQAAFFCIGLRITGRENLLIRMHAEGHLVGNHSDSHAPLFDLYSAKRMGEELAAMNAKVEAVLQLRPRLFRPPYGVTNPNLAKAVKRSGMVAVGWNIRSMDTVATDEKKLFDKLMRSLQPGAIVLFHDTAAITARLLPGFIDAVRSQGFAIVRIDELINEQPYA
jgi:peptidoglycan/xylan/chitin deacetylase (PgdA/CDA1 family)